LERRFSQERSLEEETVLSEERALYGKSKKIGVPRVRIFSGEILHEYLKKTRGNIYKKEYIEFPVITVRSTSRGKQVDLSFVPSDILLIDYEKTVNLNNY